MTARSRTGHNSVRLVIVLLSVIFLLCADPLSGEVSGQEASREARAWLDFNHHVGGFIVLLLAGLTWFEVLGNNAVKAIRLAWPVCLILIGVYNVILSDRFAWPIDSSGFMESLTSLEVLQHKILAVLVLTLGLIELLRRLQWVTHRAWPYLFYGLAALTGAILLIHDFTAAPHGHFHGFTFSHALMGLLALLAMVLKVLVDHRIILGRWSYLYPLVLAGLGMQLLFFSESSVIVH